MNYQEEYYKAQRKDIFIREFLRKEIRTFNQYWFKNNKEDEEPECQRIERLKWYYEALKNTETLTISELYKYYINQIDGIVSYRSALSLDAELEGIQEGHFRTYWRLHMSINKMNSINIYVSRNNAIEEIKNDLMSLSKNNIDIYFNRILVDLDEVGKRIYSQYRRGKYYISFYQKNKVRSYIMNYQLKKISSSINFYVDIRRNRNKLNIYKVDSSSIDRRRVNKYLIDGMFKNFNYFCYDFKRILEEYQKYTLLEDREFKYLKGITNVFKSFDIVREVYKEECLDEIIVNEVKTPRKAKLTNENRPLLTQHQMMILFEKLRKQRAINIKTSDTMLGYCISMLGGFEVGDAIRQDYNNKYYDIEEKEENRQAIISILENILNELK